MGSRLVEVPLLSYLRLHVNPDTHLKISDASASSCTSPQSCAMSAGIARAAFGTTTVAVSAAVEKSTAVTDSARADGWSARVKQGEEDFAQFARAFFFAHRPARNLSVDGHWCTIACRGLLAPDFTARSRFRPRQQFAARPCQSADGKALFFPIARG